MTLLFNEEEHRYWYKEKPEVRLTSVSTVLDMCEHKFDRDGISKKVAIKRGVTQEEVLAEWDSKRDKALDKGTRYHMMREAQMLTNPKVYRHEEVDGNKSALDLGNLSEGIYPELMLYNPFYNLVGTADYVEVLKGRRFILKDYKTNEKLEFNSFREFDPVTKRRHPKMFLPPVSHIEECNGNRYQLQLSLYAFFLEEWGYECDSLAIEHVLFDEDHHVNVIEYPVNYLKKEARNICEHFKKKNK